MSPTTLIDDLRQDWVRHLRATNKAPRTVDIYSRAVVGLTAFLTDHGLPTDPAQVTRKHIEAHLTDLSQRESPRKPGELISPAYVSQVYRSLQQYFKWLHEIEEEIDRSPFDRMKPPIVPEKLVPILTDDHIRSILDTCKGASFDERRDNAIIRMFIDTGARRSEIANIQLDDLDFTTDTVAVLGKGRRPRIVPFGDKTAVAVRRYIRTRTRHKHSDSPALWLGHSGALASDAIRLMLSRRGKQAGVSNLHAHRFRHTAAHAWLANGGQEQDLMMIAGWRSPQMLSRYGASAASERALAAHKRARLGDRF
ncbi:tyrosine-type recombinase/integrase [Pseudonocardia sp. ICBG1122]|nr:tyrosine-type recombinase/integrase [Pseudonocardia pini]